MKLTKLFRLFGCFAYILLKAYVCFSYSLTGNVLLDLQASDNSNFKAETDNWRVSSMRSSTKFSICNGTYILGGYSVLGHSNGQYFQRDYTDLPSHTEIVFSIFFWILDDWGANDKFEIKFDSTTLNAWSLVTRTGQSNLCGNDFSDLPSVKIAGKVAHTEPTLTFRVTSRLNFPTTAQSFGFRNLTFTFLSKVGVSSEEICAAAPITLPSDVLTCTCSSNQYEQPTHSGQCFQCHSDCATCTGSSFTSCASCSQGKFLDSSKQCITCHKSCATCNGPSFADCLTCASGYILRPSQNAKNSSCTLSRFQGVSEDSFLNAPMETNTATLIVLAKTMQYVRYLDINMPPRLQQLGYSRGREILSLRFGFDMPEGLKEKFARVSLPAAFEKLDLHSSFLVNFWLVLTSFVIVAIVALLSMLFEMICHSFKKEILRKIFQIVRIITTWNFCFILLGTSIGDIIIFSYLEFATFSSSEGGSLSNFSLAVCIMTIFATAFYFYGIVKIVKKVHIEKTKISAPHDFFQPSLPRWEGSRVLYDGFRRKYLIARLFFLVYLGRLALPVLISVCIQSSPVVQTVLQIIITLAILFCIFYVKPLKNKINIIQLIIFETITFILNILTLVLAIFDAKDLEVDDSIIAMGDLIIFGNFFINILILVFLLVKLWLEIKKILLLKKGQPRSEIMISFLELLAVPLHLGGMGFEQVFEDPLLDEEIEERNARVFPITDINEIGPELEIVRRGYLHKKENPEDQKFGIRTENKSFIDTERQETDKQYTESEEGTSTLRRLINLYPIDTSHIKNENEVEESKCMDNSDCRTGTKLNDLSSNCQSYSPTLTNNNGGETRTSPELMQNYLSKISLDAFQGVTKNRKRGRSKAKEKRNPDDDRFFMYKKENTLQSLSPTSSKQKKPKKKKLKNKRTQKKSEQSIEG